MKTIWKFPLKITDRQPILLPSQHTFLSIADQGGQLCLWVEVETTKEIVERTIWIVGTGNPIPRAAAAFIGTVLMRPGVWHVYEGYQYPGSMEGTDG